MIDAGGESTPNAAPAWNEFSVAYIGGTYDTRIETGEEYETRTLADIFNAAPTNLDKLTGPAFIPSTYAEYDARSHDAQRQHGRFVALTADVDSGDHAPKAIQQAVAAFVQDAAYLIYSSPHSRPGDRRWRVVVPLAEATSFDHWFDAQSALFAFLASRGIETDKALARAGQLVFLPNVPNEHAKSGTALRDGDGAPLYFQRHATALSRPGLKLAEGAVADGMAEIRRRRAADEAEREKMRAEAAQRRANKPRGDETSLIDDFNAANSVATMLEICGYTQNPQSPRDWRSPLQSGDTYATRVMDGDTWVSLSQSDTDAGLGYKFSAGCFGDAYDLYAHYKHGGDHKAAYRAIGEERRGNVIRPDRFNAPSWMAEAPLPDEMPDYPDYGAEPDVEAFEAETGLTADGAPILPFFWFNEAAPDLDANDFVEGMLTSGSMSVVYGPSNCGKTFFIVDMALHVAMGRTWRGREVDQGAVVYLSLEGAQGIRNRLSAFRLHHGLTTNLPFVAMPRPVNLLNDDADVNAVIQLVAHVAAQTDMPVRMVIIDTLSRAMAGGNENSPEDMTALIGNCDRIRDATGSHVCIVHHSGKDEARGARGHSSLRAATDTEIEIKRDPELTFSSVRVAKQRDLEAAEPFGFTLHRVPLGVNRRGKDVTSCVVLEAEQSAILARDPDKLSPKETAALESLERCLSAGGFEVETGTDSSPVTAVTVHAWKRSLQALDIIARNNDNMARPQYHRIKKALEKKGHIVVEGDKVWLA